MLKSESIKTFLVGTYTNMNFSNGKKGKGIYRMRFDTETGKTICTGVTEGLDNPSYAVLSKDRTHIYIVNEIQPKNENATGFISSYKVDNGSGNLELIGIASSCGLSPCYIALDKTEKFSFLPNYMSKSISSFAADENLVMCNLIQTLHHSGHSVHPSRQKSSFPHSVIFDRNYKHMIVADLGIDKLMVYDVNYESGAPMLSFKDAEAVDAGMGPRHMVFDRAGEYLYVICELGSVIYVYDYDDDQGTLEKRQKISTLPDSYDLDNHCADLHMSPDGKFLYGSNRGHDSIAIFYVNEDDGLLTFQENCPTGGKTPRNFAIDDSGRYMLVSNQNSNLVKIFEIDADIGSISPKSEIYVTSPTFVAFL